MLPPNYCDFTEETDEFGGLGINLCQQKGHEIWPTKRIEHPTARHSSKL